MICAINRNGQLLIPDGEITILQNDIIYVTGNRVDVILFHNFVRPKVIKSLMLIGAGKIAYYLLNILKNSKIKLKVIEINPKHAEWFSQEFPHLHIVQGDGTAKDILLEESAQHYDAVATLTGVDEENIISSMFLESMGVQKISRKSIELACLKSLTVRNFQAL